MRVWSLLIICTLLPLAQAGTSDNPEISDASDDGHPVAEKDLVKVWVEESALEEGDAALWFRIETGGDFEHVPAFFALHERYRVAFKVNDAGDEWYVSISTSRANVPAGITSIPGAGDETVSCRLAQAPSGSAAPLADEVGMTSTFDAGNQFGCLVPFDAIGFAQGDAVTSLYAEHILVARGPLAGDPPTGGDNIPYTVLETFDRAPDDGFATFQSAAPVVIEDGNATGNSTGNETLPDGGATGNETVDPGMDVDGGSGSAADCEGNTTCADGNETLDDTPDDKESPGPALPLLAMTIALVAVLRRRR